jgi:hypothetical protein
MTGLTDSYCVGFEVLTVVVMRSSILLGVMPCSPFEVNQHAPPKRRLTTNPLHGITSQKIEIFNLYYAPEFEPVSFKYCYQGNHKFR